jgi:hypothetical protein
MTKRNEHKDEPAALVTFLPTETFTGYPDGKTKVLFQEGVESVPVTEEYAQLMRDKGHVSARAHNHPVEETTE